MTHPGWVWRYCQCKLAGAKPQPSNRLTEWLAGLLGLLPRLLPVG